MDEYLLQICQVKMTEPTKNKDGFRSCLPYCTQIVIEFSDVQRLNKGADVEKAAAATAASKKRVYEFILNQQRKQRSMYED
jgi:hypothetical protein